uniref:Uncharacterized protein n=1 Tax=Tanacetum cinerariifolium TaxID=118510 RepID=A0A6L2KP92_TANCI|nr:hypothetical protein [Tanacetum cinerariifolium]
MYTFVFGPPKLVRATHPNGWCGGWRLAGSGGVAPEDCREMEIEERLATAVRKAITLLRQAIGSSLGENTGTARPEFASGNSVIGVMDKWMSNVEGDELVHIEKLEMVKTIVEAEDCSKKTDKF